MDSKLLSALWIITCATQVFAAHTRMETVGKTYLIVEQDIREEFKQKATNIGLLPIDPPPAKETLAYLASEREKWGELVRALGLEGSR